MSAGAARRVEGLLVHWPDPGTTGAPQLRVLARGVADATDAGLEVAVVTGDVALARARLPARPGLHVGLRPEALQEALAAAGVRPEQVQDAGVLDGDLSQWRAAVDEQLARRRRGDLPLPVEDPAWTVVVDGAEPLRERAHETVLSLVNGRLGTRGSVIVPDAADDPAVLLAGAFTQTGPSTHLLEAPLWARLECHGFAAARVRRTLDLRIGTLHQQLEGDQGALTSLQLCSIVDPGTVALRARGAGGVAPPAPGLAPPVEPVVRAHSGVDGDVHWMVVHGTHGSVRAAAADVLRSEADGGWCLDRAACYAANPASGVGPGPTASGARSARRAGFDAQLAAHRRKWASLWDQADIQIDGDPGLQRAVRLSLFHLLGCGTPDGEAAIGARGLTGGAYRGHVFWDTDVFVVPALAATRPRVARAALQYRVHRLAAAREAARREGRDGARFPWESARTGIDVTPAAVTGPDGRLMPVATAPLETHIVADVAWAAACYADWTDDRVFADGPGRTLLVETARYWAARIELDGDGTGHIRGVMGPDEYHAPVDDNAYTNLMAAWNLRRGAAAGREHVDDDERRRWLALAEALVDGRDPATGIYEQFAGFDALTPTVIADLARRPVMADLLLGPERTASSQVIKQADVLMAHYLIPDAVAAGSLEPNLRRYEPRTAHGSSLSPGVHAALLARAGLLDRALQWLRLTAGIDLDDLGDMTSGGVHLAAMGSVWRALTYGFAGIAPAGDALRIDPRLPAEWTRLEIALRFRGARVRIRVTPGEVAVRADRPVRAAIGAETVEAGPQWQARPLPTNGSEVAACPP